MLPKSMTVLAALLASVSGWLFAHFQRSVNPSPFGLNMGIEYLFMAVVGVHTVQFLGVEFPP